MKAVLVIEMPKSCAKCKLEDIGYCWGGGSKVRLMATERPKECPLKPIPQKMSTDADDLEEDSYWQGWNDCIKEIENA